ncbi:MAG TPA: MFS transporter [Burkholderiaceae bacterium]|nr:MFS transporter [Burkholderiaceae bacterium]
MTASAARATQPADRAIPAFLFANFVIGTGVVLLMGIMNELAAGLAVSVAQAGQLASVSAVVMAVGAPLLASITSRIDRRRLLVASLLLYALGHLACAVAPGYLSLMVIRTVAMLAPAVFTPQAAATIGLMVPPERRASAVTAIFLGWSIASVAGMPIGSLIGAHIGWRASFAFVGMLAAIATVWVARVTPAGLRVPPVSLAAWGRALGDRRLMLVLAVTLASAGAQFVLMVYLTPSLAMLTRGGPNLIAALLVLFGIAGVIGNTWISRRIDRLGTDRAVTACLALMLTAMLAWGAASLSAALLWPTLLMACIGWGLGCFSSNSAQQARLVATAPALASVSIALNTSGMYAGQAIGATVGGATLTAVGLGALPWVAAAGLVGAIALSLAAARQPARAVA